MSSTSQLVSDPNTMEVILSIVALCIALTGSAIWVFRNGMKEIKSQTADSVATVNDSTNAAFSRIETQTKESLQRMEKSSDKIIVDLKADFRRLHDHVDEKMGEMYAGVDIKTREIQNHVDRQFISMNDTFRTFQQTLQENREMTHQLDKNILNLKSHIAETYTMKVDFDKLVDQVEELKKGQ